MDFVKLYIESYTTKLHKEDTKFHKALTYSVVTIKKKYIYGELFLMDFVKLCVFFVQLCGTALNIKLYHKVAQSVNA